LLGLSDSPADVVGLRQGDLINSVNGEEVKDLAAFYRVLRERTSRELYFGFTRSGSSLESRSKEQRAKSKEQRAKSKGAHAGFSLLFTICYLLFYQ
jgi:S1-C subfamily serine protease